MTNSDIIAIVAISVSGLVSIITLVATFYTNRANNRAKLQELAFERRIEAFSETVRMFGQVKIAAYELDGSHHERNGQEFDSASKKLDGKFVEFVDTYHKNEIYFPPDIHKGIHDYGFESQEFFLGNRDQDAFDKWYKYTLSKEKEIVSAIQKFIGFR